eukprot:7770534-Pyramimonas_sp.AAC.1
MVNPTFGKAQQVYGRNMAAKLGRKASVSPAPSTPDGGRGRGDACGHGPQGTADAGDGKRPKNPCGEKQQPRTLPLAAMRRWKGHRSYCGE